VNNEQGQMTLGEQKPLRKAAIARHWGVSRAYLTKLAQEKGLPAFLSLEEADTWRAVNAPPKPGNQSRRQEAEPAAKKIADPDHTTSSGPMMEELRRLIQDNRAGEREDFLATMIRQSEIVPQVAHTAYLQAYATGRTSEISAAIKNWHEAMKAAASARSDFIEQQEKLRLLLPLAPVMDVIGTELQALRSKLLKLGEVTAVAANPDNPAMARKAIDEAVDEVFRQMTAVEQRLPKEIEAATINA
jgi:ATP-dependent DNA ligase